MDKKGAAILFIIIFIIISSIMVVLFVLGSDKGSTEPLINSGNNVNTNNIENKENDNSNEEKITFKYLTDHRRYFVLSDIIERYYSYIFVKDHNKLFSILTDEFKEKNEININNIGLKMPKYDKYYSPNIEEIYYLEKNNKVLSYFLKIILIEDDIDKQEGFENFADYLEVILDENNLTFQISPIDSVIYEENKK